MKKRGKLIFWALPVLLVTGVIGIAQVSETVGSFIDDVLTVQAGVVENPETASAQPVPDPDPRVAEMEAEHTDLLGQLSDRIHDELDCADGLEAVDLFNRKSSEIDLVILDLIMPRMSGQDAFTELKRIRPDVQILIVSGFSQDSSVTTLLDQGACGFLQKPFDISALSVKIANLLPQTTSPRT